MILSCETKGKQLRVFYRTLIMGKTVIIITGPTATGKTEAAIEVARKIGGEIISADSRQVYKHLDIGTNKPTKEQLKRASHHLIDIINPDDTFSAGDFLKLAIMKIDAMLKRGKVPVVAGGTGLYIKALTDGLIDVPADSEIRKTLLREEKSYSTAHLYEKLRALSPEAAAAIDANNPRRVVRALEIFLLTQKSVAELKCGTKKPDYDFLVFGISMPRQALYDAINLRVDRMFAAGLADEASKLIKKYSLENPVLNATIGYREIIGHMRGLYTENEAKELIKRNTRHYAKRQMTWFSKDKRITWLDAGAGPAGRILNCLEKSGIIGIRER
jgi:tRNA dimethylallyltransferase